MASHIRRLVAQQIVETVKDVCGHDINYIDPNGIIFASTDPERIGTYHEIGRQVVQIKQTIEVTTDDEYKGTHKGVNIPFLHHGEVIAVIGITGDPDEVRKYAFLAQRITALILREHETDVLAHNRQAELNYIIRSLTFEETVHYDFLEDYLKRNHLHHEMQFRTILVRLNFRYAPSNISIVESRIHNAFHAVGSELFTFNYPNEYILLLPEELWQSHSAVLRQLAAEHRELLSIGVGICCNLDRQHDSYSSAQIALASMSAESSFVVFEELDVEILLGSVTDKAKEHFIRKSVEALSKKDRSFLEAYYSCGMSLKKTCEHLFIHKNTLQYQLDRIWKETGYNPREFHDAVVLYLGLKLLGGERN